MDKHREISKILLYLDGGLIIKFKDGSHAWIEPEQMEEIIEQWKEIEEDE